MKTFRLLNIRQSLASRITMWVVLYVVITLVISVYVGNYFVLKIIREVQENGILYAIGMRKLSVALTLLFVLTLVVLTWLLRRAIHRLVEPLTTFTQAADEVARGNLQAALPDISTKDEMHHLHQSFCMMQQSLERQMEELRRYNEAKGRIDGELKVAREIQLSMLPKAYVPTANSRLEIHGSLTPAREVGGDLYDFIERDGKLFFCIGDVSGKGVPAALVMATTLCQFRIAASHVDDVEKIVRFINRAVCDGNETLIFVTFFVGMLELANGRLLCVNAGHNKPVIIDNGQLIIDNSADPRDVEAKPGLPLGIDENAPYSVYEFNLPSGSMLFLYTDGLTEAMTAQHELFGRQRLIDSLKGGAYCKEVIEGMTLAVHKFVGDAPQSDDLTMLAIRRDGM